MNSFAQAEPSWFEAERLAVPKGNGGVMKGVDRVCEMGASPDDVGFDGCTLPWKYTVPVYPGVKAVVNPPFAGVHVKDWEPATGPNTTPQHGRGGLPYIPFFYAQKSSES